jgi:hypothetical protein
MPCCLFEPACFSALPPACLPACSTMPACMLVTCFTTQLLSCRPIGPTFSDPACLPQHVSSHICCHAGLGPVSDEAHQLSHFTEELVSEAVSSAAMQALQAYACCSSQQAVSCAREVGDDSTYVASIHWGVLTGLWRHISRHCRPAPPAAANGSVLCTQGG